MTSVALAFLDGPIGFGLVILTVVLWRLTALVRSLASLLEATTRLLTAWSKLRNAFDDLRDRDERRNDGPGAARMPSRFPGSERRPQ
jgi:hypothetical protein